MWLFVWAGLECLWKEGYGYLLRVVADMFCKVNKNKKLESHVKDPKLIMCVARSWLFGELQETNEFNVVHS